MNCKGVRRYAALFPTSTARRVVLKAQVEKREQTFYLNWNDYHGIHPAHDPDEYQRLVGVYKGLAEKGIIAIRTDDTIANCHFIDPAWKILLNRYYKDPKFLNLFAEK
jgi:hypothetical protein